MKIPYKLVPAVALDMRRAQILNAIARGYRRLEPVPIDETKTLQIACYGPSLRDTWPSLIEGRKRGHPILAVSGATTWLAEQGLRVDFHLDMDPRANKVKDVSPAIPGVTYYMASACHPTVFDALEQQGATIVLWHSTQKNEQDDLTWLSQHDAVDRLLVSTGSTVGLGAIQVGGLLGYRHFEIHGMDGSSAEEDGGVGVRHAGPHSDPKLQESTYTWAAGGHTYHTSRVMANAAAETVNTMQAMPVFCVFHGTGLTQALLREKGLRNACCADDARAETVRTARPIVYAAGEGQAASPWDVLCYGQPDPQWLAELQPQFLIADGRRVLARYNTGSISLETGLLLRAVSAWRKPRHIVEVGTFIGKSALALSVPGATVWTCDRSNDCVPDSAAIRTHPYTDSAAFFRQLGDRDLAADIVFLDGRLLEGDLRPLSRLTHPRTVYLFDDYEPGGKGLANVALLRPYLHRHGFVAPHPPFAGRSTLAMLAPAPEVAA